MNVGRPLEFDPDLAMQQALEVFWSHGYKEASLQNILSETNLSKSSLYQTFRSKQHLFNLCVDRYLDNVAAQLISQLDSAKSPRQFIEDVFHGLVSKAGTPEAERGCFLLNTVIEFGYEHPLMSKRITDGMQRYVNIFVTAVERAQQAGEISRDKSSQQLGNYIMNNMSGLRLMLKGGMDYQQASGIVRLVMQTLD